MANKQKGLIMAPDDNTGASDQPTGSAGATADSTVYHWDAGALQVHDAPIQAYEATARPIYGASVGLTSADPLDVIHELRRGLPFRAFHQLQERLGVTARDLASVAGITDRTLTRRKKEGRLQTDESDRLLRIGALFDRAVEVLGGEEAANTWLKSPRAALGSRSPLENADTEPGAREVEDLLGRIEHGVFS